MVDDHRFLAVEWLDLVHSRTRWGSECICSCGGPSWLILTDLTLMGLSGESVSLEEFRGQPVIVNFWASWCGPCRAEMPALEQVAMRYADEGVVVLLVNQGEGERTISGFLAEVGLTLPVLLDSDLNATRLYRVQALPTTFFIDREGRIQDLTIGGPMTDAYLSSRVLSLLKGGP